MELTALDAGDYYSSYGDDDGAGGNSTCAQWTTCSPCLDFFDDDGSGCLWCNVPKGGGAEGLCLPRLRAQDRCEIGELQVKHSDLAFRASNHFYVSYLVFSIVGFSAAVSLLHQHSTRTAVGSCVFLAGCFIQLMNTRRMGGPTTAVRCGGQHSANGKDCVLMVGLSQALAVGFESFCSQHASTDRPASFV